MWKVHGYILIILTKSKLLRKNITIYFLQKWTIVESLKFLMIVSCSASNIAQFDGSTVDVLVFY